MPLTSEALDRDRSRTPLLITTTPGPVAALAWNTAIQNLFDTVFSWSGSKLAGQLVYPL